MMWVLAAFAAAEARGMAALVKTVHVKTVHAKPARATTVPSS